MYVTGTRMNPGNNFAYVQHYHHHLTVAAAYMCYSMYSLSCELIAGIQAYMYVYVCVWSQLIPPGLHGAPYYIHISRGNFRNRSPMCLSRPFLILRE